MHGINATEQSKKISNAYFGSARVLLRNLQREESDQICDVDQTKINKLRRLYKLNGCRRLESQNRVPVLFSPHAAQDLLSQCGLSFDDLKATFPPELPLPETCHLEYLCGQGFHRLAAADLFLRGADRWWCIDFYNAEDICETSRQFMREDYGQHIGIDDGEIFRKIRLYERANDRAQAQKWRSRLSQSKLKDLRQLRKHKRFKHLYNVLDELTVYPGLWRALEIGMFHRILPMKCPAEQVNYLRGVKFSMEKIMGDSRNLLDSHSVELMEGRSPHYCKDDRTFLQRAYDVGQLFPYLDQVARGQAFMRLLNFQDFLLVPSLRTFRDDTMWLEASQKPLRLLVATSRGSLRSSFRNCFLPIGYALLQKPDGTFENRAMNSEDAFWWSYVQLHCIAQREFPSMCDLRPRKDNRKPRATTITRNKVQCLTDLASIALKMGFDTQPIRDLIPDYPAVNVARSLLLDARPRPLFNFPDGVLTEETAKLASSLEGVGRSHVETRHQPSMTCEGYQAWDLRRRCGRTFERAFLNDQEYLFVDHILNNRPPQMKQSVTSFGVTHHIFNMFFGRNWGIEDDSDDDDDLDSPIDPRSGPSGITNTNGRNLSSSEHQTSALASQNPLSNNSHLGVNQQQDVFMNNGKLETSTAVDLAGAADIIPVSQMHVAQVAKQVEEAAAQKVREAEEAAAQKVREAEDARRLAEERTAKILDDAKIFASEQTAEAKQARKQVADATQTVRQTEQAAAQKIREAEEAAAQKVREAEEAAAQKVREAEDARRSAEKRAAEISEAQTKHLQLTGSESSMNPFETIRSDLTMLKIRFKGDLTMPEARIETGVGVVKCLVICDAGVQDCLYISDHTEHKELICSLVKRHFEKDRAWVAVRNEDRIQTIKLDFDRLCEPETLFLGCDRFDSLIKTEHPTSEQNFLCWEDGFWKLGKHDRMEGVQDQPQTTRLKRKREKHKREEEDHNSEDEAQEQKLADRKCESNRLKADIATLLTEKQRLEAEISSEKERQEADITTLLTEKQRLEAEISSEIARREAEIAAQLAERQNSAAEILAEKRQNEEASAILLTEKNQLEKAKQKHQAEVLAWNRQRLGVQEHENEETEWERWRVEAERKRREWNRQRDEAEQKLQKEKGEWVSRKDEAEKKYQDEEAEWKRQREVAKQKYQDEEAQWIHEAEQGFQDEKAEWRRRKEEAEKTYQDEEAEWKRQREVAKQKYQDEEAEWKRLRALKASSPYTNSEITRKRKPPASLQVLHNDSESLRIQFEDNILRDPQDQITMGPGVKKCLVTNMNGNWIYIFVSEHLNHETFVLTFITDFMNERIGKDQKPWAAVRSAHRPNRLQTIPVTTANTYQVLFLGSGEFDSELPSDGQIKHAFPTEVRGRKHYISWANGIWDEMYAEDRTQPQKISNEKKRREKAIMQAAEAKEIAKIE